MATTGTLTRKTARQDTACTSSPPMSGPAMTMAEVAAAHVPMARPRASPAHVAVMIASAWGTSSAPAAPWTSRATTSASSVGAVAHTTDVRPKPKSPIAKIRRRPNASPSAPASTSSAASTVRYPLVT